MKRAVLLSAGRIWLLPGARSSQASPFSWILNFRQYPALALVGMGLLTVGCASPRGSGSNSGDVSVHAQPVSRFGKLAVAEESSPASFSFQKAKGKLGSAKEAIVDSAELGLSGPGAGVIVVGAVLSGCSGTGSDAIGEAALAGAVGGVTAIGAALVGPVVGAEGLVRSLRKVRPAELAEREAALTNALNHMAAQQRFRGVLLETGSERIRPGFFYPE